MKHSKLEERYWPRQQITDLCKCGRPAHWIYSPRPEWVACHKCVPRACSCNDSYDGTDEKFRPDAPCCEFEQVDRPRLKNRRKAIRRARKVGLLPKRLTDDQYEEKNAYFNVYGPGITAEELKTEAMRLLAEWRCL